MELAAICVTESPEGHSVSQVCLLAIAYAFIFHCCMLVVELYGLLTSTEMPSIGMLLSALQIHFIANISLRTFPSTLPLAPCPICGINA
jgi:hypothetical protein